jgi:hypothetical protein
MSKKPETTVIEGPRIPPHDLATWTDADLRAELVRGLTMTAAGLARMGWVWQELERRGCDLSDLRQGIALYLPEIASGRLAPEAVVAFASRRSILRALTGVPLNEQRRLAAGGTLPIIDPGEPDASNEYPLASLPSSMLPVVFAGDGDIRTPQLQRLFLRSRTPRIPPREAARVFRPRYDPSTGIIIVGKMSVRLSDLLSELAASAGTDKPLLDENPAAYHTVKVRLTTEELERLGNAARKSGLPEWELGRKALRAFGLI